MALRNTNQQSPAYWWCFTWNNYPVPIDPIVQGFREFSKKFIFQEEIGEHGTPHLQGTIKFNDKTRFTALRRRYADAIHWEKCRDPTASQSYCSDVDKRAPGGSIWSRGYPRPLVTITDLRKWQTDLAGILRGSPDPRRIIWRWESVGNSGKSAFAKWVCVRDEFNAIYVSGKAADVKCAIVKHLEVDDCNRDDLIVIWDVPRTLEKYISYTAIEEIKNGIFFSGKYESCQVVFNTPHVLVFANFFPDTSRHGPLSVDRWDVEEIVLEIAPAIIADSSVVDLTDVEQGLCMDNHPRKPDNGGWF